MYLYVYISIDTYIYKYIYVCITHTQPHAHMCIGVSTLNHFYVYWCIHTQPFLCISGTNFKKYIYVYIYVLMYTYTYMSKYIDTYYIQAHTKTLTCTCLVCISGTKFQNVRASVLIWKTKP